MEKIKATETIVDDSLRERKMHGTVEFPVGVYLDDFTDFKNGYICWHWHEEVQISWILEGEFQCQIEGKSFLLKPGDMVFINSGILHQIRPMKNGFGKLYAFIWNTNFISGDPDSAVYQEAFEFVLKRGQHFFVFSDHTTDEEKTFHAILQEIVLLYTQQSPYFHLQIKILLSQIWLQVCKRMGDKTEKISPERKRDEERMKLAMNYMREHYNESFSLEKLAKQALTSRSELCRCFQRVLKISPKEFLMQYRIHQARILLKNPEYRSNL